MEYIFGIWLIGLTAWVARLEFIKPREREIVAVPPAPIVTPAKRVISKPLRPGPSVPMNRPKMRS